MKQEMQSLGRVQFHYAIIPSFSIKRIFLVNTAMVSVFHLILFTSFVCLRCSASEVDQTFGRKIGGLVVQDPGGGTLPMFGYRGAAKGLKPVPVSDKKKL